jgi:hypothetical protein
MDEWRTSSWARLGRLRRPKFICSPSYEDFRSRVNTVMWLDLDCSNSWRVCMHVCTCVLSVFVCVWECTISYPVTLLLVWKSNCPSPGDFNGPELMLFLNTAQNALQLTQTCAINPYRKNDMYCLPCSQPGPCLITVSFSSCMKDGINHILPLLWTVPFNLTALLMLFI